MAKRVVVFSQGANSASVGDVVARLRSRGVEIVEEQPHMLLVSGTKETVGRALDDVQGWRVTDLTMTPPPETRHRVLKKLS